MKKRRRIQDGRNKESDPASGIRSRGRAGLKIDSRRYRKIRWFFLKVLWQIFLWDIVFTLPLLKWLRPSPLPRWRRVARGFKEMAMELGGVLIKLGQFLSIRMDILPPSVIVELADLQDEVEPAKYETIVEQIEEDFGRSLTEIFEDFSREPLGAASLAQAHLASLHDGGEVVVKALRPGIHILVETDLAAIDLVCGWLKMFKHIRDSMDLDRLMEEFTLTTRNELDLLKERENIERFTDDFKDDSQVYIPRVYKEHSAGRALTMENVYYIKIGDTEAIEACGVGCARVADKLYNIYMRQIFVTNFVHVDPHPGNLFVKPLPFPDEARKGVAGFAPGEPTPYRKRRPFQIVFIDFGMVAVIPDRLKAAMRMAAIGVGTRDAHKIVQAYVIGGMLQPGADLRRLEQAHEDWLQRLWGVRMGRIQAMAYKEARYFLREYRDLIAETPFQFQADMLFVGRAFGILAGMSTNLDPEFDPWAKTIPFAKRFAAEELKADWKGWDDEILILGQHLLKLPTELTQTLIKARQGSLAIQVSLSPETRKAIKRIDLSVKRFSWMVLTAALLIAGVNLHIDEKHPILSISLLILAVATFLWGMRKS